MSILEQYYTACRECHCEMPNEDVRDDGRCRWCHERRRLDRQDGGEYEEHDHELAEGKCMFPGCSYRNEGEET